MTAIYIYFLIGVASWATHMVQCEGCHRVLRANVAFGLEGVTKVAGWPIDVFMLGLSYMKSDTREVREPNDDDILRFMRSKSKSGNVIEMRQESGESDADFHVRIQKMMSERMAAKMAEKRDENST